MTDMHLSKIFCQVEGLTARGKDDNLIPYMIAALCTL